MITVTATNNYLLISPSIHDSNLTIDLNITIHKWRSTCHYILTGLSGTSRYLTSILQVSQYTILYQ